MRRVAAALIAIAVSSAAFAECGPAVRGPADRGPADRGPADRGPADRGPAEPRPEWAFFVPRESAGPPTARISGPQPQRLDVLNPPDWYPTEHPAMPAVVAHGSPPQGAATAPLLPCALCHLPNGAGHVESASLAGLPEDYILRQFAAFRSGERRIAVGDAHARQFLSTLKSRYTNAQVHAAALYFSALAPRPWIQVREAKQVPVSVVDSDSLMRTAVAGEGTEALGRRIIELPENESALRRRDAHSGFIAYVPVGSLAAGKALVTSDAHAPPCTACHGESLRGLGAIPPLAGRPPTYLVRQLWEYQSGERHGRMAAPMREIAAQLKVDDMLAMAAYLASMPP